MYRVRDARRDFSGSDIRLVCVLQTVALRSPGEKANFVTDLL
jgi:hypothetical protein